MNEKKETIAISANIEITAASIQTVVEKAKKSSGRNEKGFYRIDTADILNGLISRFLLEHNFEEWVKDIDIQLDWFLKYTGEEAKLNPEPGTLNRVL